MIYAVELGSAGYVVGMFMLKNMLEIVMFKLMCLETWLEG